MRTMISCPCPGNRWLVKYYARAGYSKHCCSILWKMDMDIFSIQCIHILAHVRVLVKYGEIPLKSHNFWNYPIILYPNWYHDPIVFNINPIILLLQKWWDPLKYGIPNGSPWVLLFKKWWDPHWIPKIFVEFLWSTLRDLRDLRLEELGDQDFKARPGRS